MFDFYKHLRQELKKETKATTTKKLKIEFFNELLPTKTVRLPADQRISVSLNEQGQHVWHKNKSANFKTSLVGESNSRPGVVHFLDPNTGDCFKKLECHAQEIECVHYMADRHELVTASNDRTLKHWDIRRDKCVLTLKDLEYAIDWMHLRPNTSHLIIAKTCGLGVVKQVALATGHFLGTTILVRKVIFSLVLLSNAKHLAILSKHELSMWDLDAGECVKELKNNATALFTCMVLIPLNDTIATGSERDFIQIWDLYSDVSMKHTLPGKNVTYLHLPSQVRVIIFSNANFKPI